MLVRMVSVRQKGVCLLHAAEMVCAIQARVFAPVARITGEGLAKRRNVQAFILTAVALASVSGQARTRAVASAALVGLETPANTNPVQSKIAMDMGFVTGSLVSASAMLIGLEQAVPTAIVQMVAQAMVHVPGRLDSVRARKVGVSQIAVNATAQDSRASRVQAMGAATLPTENARASVTPGARRVKRNVQDDARSMAAVTNAVGSVYAQDHTSAKSLIMMHALTTAMGRASAI